MRNREEEAVIDKLEELGFEAFNSVHVLPHEYESGLQAEVHYKTQKVTIALYEMDRKGQSLDPCIERDFTFKEIISEVAEFMIGKTLHVRYLHPTS